MIVRTETWNGFSRGQRIKVKDTRWPKFYGKTFEFLCFCRNEDSGKEWVEVWTAQTGVRAFKPGGIVRTVR